MSRDRIVRQTSAEVYRELIESGALSGMRGEVWAWLYRHGPATRNEVAQGIRKVPNDTSTRLKELVDMGNAWEAGEDRCKVTGNNVIVYDVTNQRFVGERPKRRGKKKPVIQGVSCCMECPMRTLDDSEEFEVCGLNTELGVSEDDDRPSRCKLNDRDVVLRGV